MMRTAITAAATNSAASTGTPRRRPASSPSDQPQQVRQRRAEQAAEAGGDAPAPRPRGPCACPRAALAPSPASCIIAPIAATAKTPLAKPERDHRRRSAADAGAAWPSTAIATSAAAEPRQPADDPAPQRPEPQPARGERRPSACPRNTPPFCAPDSDVRLPRGEAEDQPGIGLEDQLLHEVGGHRQKARRP